MYPHDKLWRQQKIPTDLHIAQSLILPRPYIQWLKPENFLKETPTNSIYRNDLALKFYSRRNSSFFWYKRIYNQSYI